MNTQPKLEFIQLAKELTRSTNIDDIIDAARKLEGYLDEEDDGGFDLPDTASEFLEQCMIWTTKGQTMLKLHEYQKSWLDWLDDNQNASTSRDPEIMIAARQMGVSTVFPLYGLFYGVANPWSRVMIVTPRTASSIEHCDRVRIAIDGMGIGVKSSNRFQIVLENGSEITFANQHDVDRYRGQNIVILLDASFYPYSQDDNMKRFVYRQLADGGRVVIATASRYRGGFVHDYIRDNVPYIATTWDEHPDREAGWSDTIRKQLSEDQWRMEMECSFISHPDEYIRKK